MEGTLGHAAAPGDDEDPLIPRIKGLLAAHKAGDGAASDELCLIFTQQLFRLCSNILRHHRRVVVAFAGPESIAIEELGSFFSRKPERLVRLIDVTEYEQLMPRLIRDTKNRVYDYLRRAYANKRREAARFDIPIRRG